MNKLAKLKTRKGGLGKNEHPAGLTTYRGNSGKNRGNGKEFIPRWIENPKGRSRQKWDDKKQQQKQTKANMQKALSTDAISKMCLALKHPTVTAPSKRFYSLQVYEWDVAPCSQPWSRCVFQRRYLQGGFSQAYVRARAITCPIFRCFVYLREIVFANCQPSCTSRIHTCIIMHLICSCI